MEMKKTHRMLSLILKAVTFTAAVLGTLISAYAGRNSFMGGSRVFMYFTIQSNIFSAIVAALGAAWILTGKRVRDGWFVVKYVSAVAITLTGFVFTFVLAPTLGRAAWNFQNTLTHVVVPVAAVLDLFVSGRYGTVRKWQILFVMVPPFLYVIYAGIGYLQGWEFANGIHYPYFFLNWGGPAGAFGFMKRFPFMGTVWWIVALMFFLALTGFLYLLILDRLKKHDRKKSAEEMS